jgi:hypothetical protein
MTADVGICAACGPGFRRDDGVALGMSPSERAGIIRLPPGPCAMSIDSPQSTSHVVMIRPARFASNPETLDSNRFQTAGTDDSAQAQRAAQAEFDALVRALEDAGVEVHVFEDTPTPVKPDAVFPNNWFSTHADGSVVLYPMLAPNRRLERRLDIIEALHRRDGFHVHATIDLTHRELDGKCLEGTGSLVLDRIHRIAYACLSPRTDLDVLGEFGQRLDYDVAAFDASDANGAPIYHTNVLMSVGTRFAAVCTAAIEPGRRAAIVALLETTGRQIVDLTLDQMHSFAGNMLELRTREGACVIAMSASALQSLAPGQRAALEACGSIVSAPIPTIERLGGGSVRCMIAEVFLPREGGSGTRG